MTLLRTLVLLAGCCLVASAAFGQEERGPLWEVQVLEVPPARVRAFQDAARGIVESATRAGVGADYGWHMWSSGFDYVVASPISSFAAFDDPEAWMRQFGEEEGGRLREIFAQMENEIGVRPTSREVLEMVPAWTYDATDSPAPRFGAMYTLTLAPGSYEAFDALLPELVALIQEMGYRYDILGYRTHFGDVGNVHFLIPHDNPASFFGDESFEAAASRADRVDRYHTLLRRLNETIDDLEMNLYEYHADLSYTAAANE